MSMKPKRSSRRRVCGIQRIDDARDMSKPTKFFKRALRGGSHLISVMWRIDLHSDPRGGFCLLHFSSAVKWHGSRRESRATNWRGACSTGQFRLRPRPSKRRAVPTISRQFQPTRLKAAGSRLRRSGLPLAGRCSRAFLRVSEPERAPPRPGPAVIGAAESQAKETRFAKPCKPGQTIANAMRDADVPREAPTGIACSECPRSRRMGPRELSHRFRHR